jgi:hypothetical protein
VLCWGVSFFFGCRRLAFVNSILYANFELIKVENMMHPRVGTHPQIVAAASEGIRQAIQTNIERSNRYGKWQFRFLIMGAVFYISWHVLEMWFRVGTSTSLSL